ncbi:hypothetical protein NYE37_13620 [Thermoactinomyces sp. FSL K6-2592]|jgi:hypothetical protein
MEDIMEDILMGFVVVNVLAFAYVFDKFLEMKRKMKSSKKYTKQVGDKE